MCSGVSPKASSVQSSARATSSTTPMSSTPRAVGLPDSASANAVAPARQPSMVENPGTALCLADSVCNIAMLRSHFASFTC